MTKRRRMTIAEMEAEDAASAKRNAERRRMFGTAEKLEAVGLDLDDLIELIEARKAGRY